MQTFENANEEFDFKNSESKTEETKSSNKKRKPKPRNKKSSEDYLAEIKKLQIKYRETKKREQEELKENENFAYSTFGEMLVKCFDGDWKNVDVERLSSFLSQSQQEIKSCCEVDEQLSENESIKKIREHVKETERLEKEETQ
jgi:hypothetical protein